MMVVFLSMALGAYMFVPAARGRTYGLFLFGLFLIGIGLAILQTAANPYITILKPKERAAQRISIMGICNRGAGILAPILFAAAILRPTDEPLFSQLHLMSETARNAETDALIGWVIVPSSEGGRVGKERVGMCRLRGLFHH